MTNDSHDHLIIAALAVGAGLVAFLGALQFAHALLTGDPIS